MVSEYRLNGEEAFWKVAQEWMSDQRTWKKNQIGADRGVYIFCLLPKLSAQVLIIAKLASVYTIYNLRPQDIGSRDCKIEPAQ